MQHGARRRHRTPLVAGLAVLLLLLGIGAGWLLGRDDDAETDGPEEAGSSPTALAEQAFEVAGVPFTFQYPGSFASADPPTGITWVAGISPVDIIDVKRVADEEIGPRELGRSVRRTLQRTAGITLAGEGTAKAGQTDLITFVVDNDASGTVLRSDLHYFAAGGATWQLECQSQADNRATIDAACSRALDTLAVR